MGQRIQQKEGKNMFIIKIVAFVLMFACIVIVHEWGHFIVAKKCDVLVHEFAVGMGPVIWAKQKGETRYTIRALPIGGFCSMEEELGSEDGPDEKKDEIAKPKACNPRGMSSKKPWQKFLIVVAGATMNFILAVVLLSIFIGYRGYSSNEIAKLEAGMPAQQAGLQIGDKIIAVNGKHVKLLSDLSEVVTKEPATYTLQIKRQNQVFDTQITTVYNKEAERSLFGFTTKAIHFNLWMDIKGGFLTAVMIIKMIFTTFVSLFTGGVAFKDLSGIVGVVDQSSKIWDASVQAGGMTYAVMDMVYLAALLSANLCIFNLLPIPALDGGRLVFIIIEMIRGKAIPPEKEGAVHFAGMVLLMLLTVVVFYNDIVRLVG